MRRSHLLAMSCITAVAIAASVQAAEPSLIGMVVPPWPDGLKSNTGSCVGSGSEPGQVCARSIATLDDAEDRTLKLLASQFVDRLGDEPRWRITDAVPYPVLRRDELVVIATCQRDGVDDAGLVAIVDTGTAHAAELDMLPATRWAMRLDRATGKFIRVAPSRVRCYNEGTSE
ncbi:hypothetical protein MNR01_07425 [Lysobacter sp. S4-A87]|uniref:hypothetical protein n=1 Tax=Lysobacter sp. S4-A87 TaxID=2925843 RepID=UPI001F52B50C|nr:hypothetical protein [Lysobacter sp. S4-A87]UNK50823.1 hypothetical protein MNR01_07425 [Lysobacter sp. S4-A87]